MLTAAQIVNLTCQVCNIPGRTVQVGQFLTVLLAHYSQTIDEDAIRKTTTLNIGPQTTIPFFYALPSDYLRFYDVFYLVNGEPFYLSQMELKDLDKQYTGEGIDNYPERFATDISQTVQPTAGTSPSIAFYPPPAVPLAVTVRYRPQLTDIAAPETSSAIPWFPNQLVLLQDLCDKAMWLSDDSRRPEFKSDVSSNLRKYLAISDDKEGFAQRVALDPNTFRLRRNLPPSKKTGF